MNGFQKIKKEFDEDPFGVAVKLLFIAGSAVTINSVLASAQSKRAYAKQINHTYKTR